MTQSAFNFEARYKTTDQIIARYHITQVLELATGLSPRGLAMTEDLNVVHVATDLPEILEQEKAIAESTLTKWTYIVKTFIKPLLPDCKCT